MSYESDIPCAFDAILLSGHPFAFGSIGNDVPVVNVVFYSMSCSVVE